MGCDIHSVAERRRPDGTWEAVENASAFGCAGYVTFAFLAGVRNSFDVPPISNPRGIPDNASEHTREEYESWCSDAHSASWLSVEELAAFDYDREFQQWVGRYDFEDEFETTTYRKFLRPFYFQELEELRSVKRVPRSGLAKTM